MDVTRNCLQKYWAFDQCAGLFTIYTHSQSLSLSLFLNSSTLFISVGVGEGWNRCLRSSSCFCLTGRCQLTLREWNFRMLTTMCYTDLPVYLFFTCKTPGMCKIIQVINYKQFANMLTVSWSEYFWPCVCVYFCEGISSCIYVYSPLFPYLDQYKYCISIIVLYSKLDYFGSYVMRKTNDT